MAITLIQLGQARPADTGTATLFNPVTLDYTMRSLVICNTSTDGTVSARVFHDDDGLTYDETTALAWDIPVGSNSVVNLELSVYLSDATGNIGVRSNVANALTFTAYGSEISP